MKINEAINYYFHYYLKHKKCAVCKKKDLKSKEELLFHITDTHGIPKEFVEDFIKEYNANIIG